MNRKNILGTILVLCLAMALMALAGCAKEKKDPGIEDGSYIVSFTTDSKMFHINEAYGDKAILTVKDGEMTVHVTLQSKKIVKLYPGLAEDAEKDEKGALEPTKDVVDFGDGTTMEVYGFDVPVPALFEEFDLALLGYKGKWYDHKVKISDPAPGDQLEVEGAEGEGQSKVDLEEGDYQVDVKLDGGTGRATVESPAKVTVKDGKAILTLVWSSSSYDYMIVDGEKYLPVNSEGNSTFEFPVPVMGEAFEVIADTTAMSEPHEIDYKLTCTLKE